MDIILINGERITASSVMGNTTPTDESLAILKTKFQLHVQQYGVTLEESYGMLIGKNMSFQHKCFKIHRHWGYRKLIGWLLPKTLHAWYKLAESGFRKLEGKTIFPLDLTSVCNPELTSSGLSSHIQEFPDLSNLNK